ncbi:MAG: type IV pilin-like G/H family protein, partial [Cyanobacteriota bacterium]
EIESLQQGAFTHALLEGLGVQGKCATVERLNQYLLHRVPELNRQHGKGRQTPYTIAEPVTKSHLILLPRFATLADISTLKNDAYRAAQIDEDLELAEQLWIRVLAAASGQDMDAVKALQKIAQLRVGSSEAALPSNPANQNVGDKSPNFKTFAEPTCIQFNINPNSSRDDLSSVQELDYLGQEQLLATEQGREVNEESFSQTQSANPPQISQAINSSVSPAPHQVLAGFFSLVLIGIICVPIVTSSHWVLTGFFYLIITGILAAIALPSFLNQAAKAKQSEAKTYIGCINRAQQAFYLEKSQFASRIEELAIGIRAETQHYMYKICVLDKTKTLATATAKEDGLKSYAGAVFVIKDGEGNHTTIAALCETAQASRTPPKMPQLVGSNIECAPDSLNPSKL